jgi:hypothetical protein
VNHDSTPVDWYRKGSGWRWGGRPGGRPLACFSAWTSTPMRRHTDLLRLGRASYLPIHVEETVSVAVAVAGAERSGNSRTAMPRVSGGSDQRRVEGFAGLLFRP